MAMQNYKMKYQHSVSLIFTFLTVVFHFDNCILHYLTSLLFKDNSETRRATLSNKSFTDAAWSLR